MFLLKKAAGGSAGFWSETFLEESRCGSGLHVGCLCDAKPAEKERQQCVVFALRGTASTASDVRVSRPLSEELSAVKSEGSLRKGGDKPF